MIRDELAEVAFLEEPIICLAEWIPFGPHQFEHFVDALMASWASPERPAFLTDEREEESRECFIELKPDKALVRVCDIIPGERASFTASIFYKEAEGITQKEEIWVDVFSHGLVLYSSKITSVLYDRASRASLRGERSLVSLDRMSRIVADLMEDTSRLMSTLLSPYQRRILDVVYPKSKESLYERRKLVFVITKDVKIWMEGKWTSLWNLVKNDEDLGRVLREIKALRLELQQIIEFVMDYFVEPGEVVVVRGTGGCLILVRDEENLKQVRDVMLLNMSLTTLNVFFKYLMARAWMIWDELMEMKRACFERREGRDFLKAREDLSEVLSNVILLDDARMTIEKTIENLRARTSNLHPSGGFSEKLIDMFEPQKVVEELDEKEDLAENTLHALRTDIEGLISILTTLAEEEMRQIRIRMDENIRRQRELMEVEKMESDLLIWIEMFSGGLLVAQLVLLIFEALEGAGIYIPAWLGWLKPILTLAIVLGFVYWLFQRLRSRVEKLKKTIEGHRVEQGSA